MERNNKRFLSLIGRKVKVLFLDDGETKVITGILQEVNDNYIMVNDVAIGLGTNFISCIPKED